MQEKEKIGNDDFDEFGKQKKQNGKRGNGRQNGRWLTQRLYSEVPRLPAQGHSLQPDTRW